MTIKIKILLILLLSLGWETGLIAQDRTWKSGIELGTGLSFTGYNANLAYTLEYKENIFFAGPKIVYSDANTLFDTHWGLQAGYRRLFRINAGLVAFASLEYQAVFFKYNILETNVLNSIQEFHFSYGFQYFLTDHWSIGNSLGAGAYLERLVDPLDQKVSRFSGYSAHVRLFLGYHF